MADDPTWDGLAKGLLVLGVLWWAWVGYAWLTSVVDPEEGVVRLAMFAAMAALLVVALCVPEAFGDSALAVRGRLRASCASAQIALFVLASRDDPALRRSVDGLASGTAVGVGPARGGVVRSTASAQGALWALALVLDMGGPFLFGSEGWKLVPAPLRRAPRADHHHRPGRVDRRDRRRRRGTASTPASSPRRCSASRWRPRCGGSTSTSSRWSRRGACRTRRSGREQNEMARDSYSYLHFPMVAGIVLVALGPEEDARARRRAAEARARPWRCSAARRSTCSPTSPSAGATCTASAASGSPARWSLCALIPLATELAALVTLAIVAAAARGPDRLRDVALRRAARPAAPPARAARIRAPARRGSRSAARSRRRSRAPCPPGARRRSCCDSSPARSPRRRR